MKLLPTVTGLGFFPHSLSRQGQFNKAQGNAAQYPASHRSLKANLYFSPITGQEKRKSPTTLRLSLCQWSWKMRQFKAGLPFPFLQPGACSYLGCIWRVFSLKQLSIVFGICKWEDSVTFQCNLNSKFSHAKVVRHWSNKASLDHNSMSFDQSYNMLCKWHAGLWKWKQIKSTLKQKYFLKSQAAQDINT